MGEKDKLQVHPYKPVSCTGWNKAFPRFGKMTETRYFNFPLCFRRADTTGNSIEKNDHNVSRFRSVSADWNAYWCFICVSAKRIRSENRDFFPRGFSSFGKMKWRQFSVHVYYWICALNNTWTIVLHHANTSIFHQKKPGQPRKFSGKINIYTWCIHTACFINIFRKRREPTEGYGWKTSYSIIHLT